MSREAIARVVMQHAERRGESYRLRWDVASTAGTFIATEAQAFRAPLVGGGETELATQGDPRPVVLVFWASWCQPCLDEAPHLVRLRDRLGDRVQLVSVSIDEVDGHDELRAIVAKLGITYPVALDPGGTTILPKYARGVGIPLTFVIGSDGKVRHTQRNYRPGDEVVLAREVDAALAVATR